jgi:hypothetical protein
MARKRWQDWINPILGLWTFISPWVFGFAASTSYDFEEQLTRLDQ